MTSTKEDTEEFDKKSINVEADFIFTDPPEEKNYSVSNSMW